MGRNARLKRTRLSGVKHQAMPYFNDRGHRQTDKATKGTRVIAQFNASATPTPNHIPSTNMHRAAGEQPKDNILNLEL